MEPKVYVIAKWPTTTDWREVAAEINSLTLGRYGNPEADRVHHALPYGCTAVHTFGDWSYVLVLIDQSYGVAFHMLSAADALETFSVVEAYPMMVPVLDAEGDQLYEMVFDADGLVIGTRVLETPNRAAYKYGETVDEDGNIYEQWMGGFGI